MSNSTADYILEINNLSVAYETDTDTVHAVNRINLKVERGKTLGLVGETGAGKTTAMLSILGLLPEGTGRITSGEVIFNGKNLFEASSGEMRMIRGNSISMIYQDPMSALNPVMTVGKQIEEAIANHNTARLSKVEIAQKTDEILETVGISRTRRNEYPHQFSGGMKQRVVIAMALVCEPELLIADEPTTALDVTIQAQVLQLMDELRQKFNMSMLMITHDFGIIAQTCDEVAVMYAGEIVERGTLEDLFKPGNMHHPYTESLFNAIPTMNQNAKRLTPIEGMMPDPTNLPEGCVFSPRCSQCMEICKTQKPTGKYDSTHMIVCHLNGN